MYKIIQHVKEFLDKIYLIKLEGITDLDAAASVLTEDSKELSRKILQTIIEEMNASLREDKASRKELGLVLHEKDRERKLLTELGEVEFSRDYYYRKEDDRYEYPLDKMLSIQPRARIGETICAKLVTKATEESYGKSAADVTGGDVSRQTVRNKILKAPALEKQPEGTEKRQVRVLDVYADEDHVHMQKPFKERGKKNKVVPLVTVTEGIRRVDKRRNETVNPMHFVDENMCAKDLWASVEGYIDKVYDLDHIESMRIHADGGKWIVNGLENFAKVEHVMDGYHLQKELKKFDRRFNGKTVKYRLSKALEENNRDKAELILAELYKDCSEYARRFLEEQKTGYDLSWMSDMSENYVFDTASGTQQAIKFLGRTNSSIFS